MNARDGYRDWLYAHPGQRANGFGPSPDGTPYFGPREPTLLLRELILSLSVADYAELVGYLNAALEAITEDEIPGA